MPNFIEIGQTSLEKSVTNIFYTLQYLGSPGGPPGQRVTSQDHHVHQPPSIATWKISSSSDDPSSRYLLPNLVDFVAGVMDKKKQKNKHIQ